MKIFIQTRFWLIYISVATIILIISIFFSNILYKFTIYDFIGDVLYFSSIMTGFLGAMLGIFASISKSTNIMKTIFEVEQAKLQLILSIIIPFSVGMINIIICALFRFLLKNSIVSKLMLISFISSTLFFIFSSIIMVGLIFTFYFVDDKTEEAPVSMKKPQKRS